MHEHIVEEYPSDEEDEAMYRDEDTTAVYALGGAILEEVQHFTNLTIGFPSRVYLCMRPYV